MNYDYVDLSNTFSYFSVASEAYTLPEILKPQCLEMTPGMTLKFVQPLHDIFPQLC